MSARSRATHSLSPLPRQVVGVDVGGDNLAGRADLFGQPYRHRTAPRSDLETAPARLDEDSTLDARRGRRSAPVDRVARPPQPHGRRRRVDKQESRRRRSAHPALPRAERNPQGVPTQPTSCPQQAGGPRGGGYVSASSSRAWAWKLSLASFARATSAAQLARSVGDVLRYSRIS